MRLHLLDPAGMDATAFAMDAAPVERVCGHAVAAIDQGAVGPSMCDPLPHPIDPPLASHLLGRRCGLFRRPGIGLVRDLGVAVITAAVYDRARAVGKRRKMSALAHMNDAPMKMPATADRLA